MWHAIGLPRHNNPFFARQSCKIEHDLYDMGLTMTQLVITLSDKTDAEIARIFLQTF